MSDQGFYQRSIQGRSAAVQNFTADGEIAGGVSVVTAETSGGLVLARLPDQLAAAGQTIVVVNIGGGNNAGVNVQSGDSLNGTVDGQSLVGVGVLAFAAYTSLGSAGWLRVL